MSMNDGKSRLAGKLLVVGTPIGNVEDLGARAREVLGRVDIIAAEDTRRTGRLLSRIGIKARLFAYHEHNENSVTADLVARLSGGEDIALVSDAGMPLISDPGWRLVRAAREAGIEVLSVPGPCAVSAALSVSGLPTDRYVFEGFLPRRAGQRDARLAALADEPRTLVFFESVHRLDATLTAMARHFGSDREAALARELTKLHEATRQGTLAELAAALGGDIPLLGEFVIVVAGIGAGADRTPSTRDVSRIYALLVAEVPADVAVSLCAKITGIRRNVVYSLTRR